MRGVIGPREGYDFGAKRHYRRHIWSSFRSYKDLVSKFERTYEGNGMIPSGVVFMPSSSGDEIEWAKTKGFRESDLHVVDHNPAVVAHLKRKYPGINTYGVDVFRAIRRIRKTGIAPLCFSLDLTSGITPDVCEKLTAAALCRDFTSGAIVTINFLRGREPRDFCLEMKSKCNHYGIDQFYWRDLAIVGCFAAADYALICHSTHQYKSVAGSQTFRSVSWIALDMSGNGADEYRADYNLILEARDRTVGLSMEPKHNEQYSSVHPDLRLRIFSEIGETMMGIDKKGPPIRALLNSILTKQFTEITQGCTDKSKFTPWTHRWTH